MLERKSMLRLLEAENMLRVFEPTSLCEGTYTCTCIYIYIYKYKLYKIIEHNYSIEENPTWQTSCFHEALEIRQGSIKTQLLVTSFNKWQRILLHVRGNICCLPSSIISPDTGPHKSTNIWCGVLCPTTLWGLVFVYFRRLSHSSQNRKIMKYLILGSLSKNL